ncbi:MAG: META domain-containing protein [Muribaculaceae bacterium]|nr:META domain-containing protein [Muribaculaceae bacterium]
MKHLSTIAAISTLALLSSCSAIQKVTGSKSSPSAPASESGSTSASTPASKPSETVSVSPVKVNGKSKKGKKKPSDTAAVAEVKAQAPTKEQLLGGQWSIIAVGKTQINLEDDQPYVNFDADGRFYANDGCNIINGDYAVKSDGKMLFSNVLSTMKYCPELDFTPSIASVFATEDAYTADCRRIGQDTYLYLKDGRGMAVATLRRDNMEFLNGNWRITSAEGTKIESDEANIFIDVRELKVHGNTGCNYFNGVLYLDPSRSNAVDFSNMALTRMMCPNEDQERSIMVALEGAASAIAGKNSNTVLLLDAKGKQVMTLVRIPVEKPE